MTYFKLNTIQERSQIIEDIREAAREAIPSRVTITLHSLVINGIYICAIEANESKIAHLSCQEIDKLIETFK